MGVQGTPLTFSHRATKASTLNTTKKMPPSDWAGEAGVGVHAFNPSTREAEAG